MKKIILALVLVGIMLPANAKQTSYSDGTPTGYGQSSQTTKVYDKYGSLKFYSTPKSNGTTRYYNKYHQFVGYSKKDGSKTKYFPKN